jgi:outer membrane protein TolC
MRKILVVVSFAFLQSAAAFAQAPAAPAAASAGPTLELTVDQAVKMALDQNVDLAAERLDPQISDTSVAVAEGAFRPIFGSSLQSNNQLQPPSSFLIPTSTRTDIVTSGVSLNQRLNRFGTLYSIAWNSSHTNSNSFLNSYNPLVQSGLALTLSQPLIRGFSTDVFRTEVALSQIDRSIADTRLRETLVHTTANVKIAYWNLVSAIANVDARKSAVDLAAELARVNKVKVDVGQSPPLDLLSAQAEVASDQEQLIIAETAVRQTEDQLRVLIFDPTNRDNWNIKLVPVDSPPLATTAVDVDAAVTNALRDRTDLDRARKDVLSVSTSEKLAANQRLADVRLNASYQANGLGGTQVLRAGGFPGTIVGPGDVTGFGSILGQLFSSNYPTWAVGVSVAVPVGRSIEDANYARTTLQRQQAALQVKSAESQAIQQVRNAGWNIETDAKRIETTRVGRELAEQRLDAERKRFEVGLSTSFLVIQAQRDLAQAKQNELASILSYDLALVDFEVLQQAGPSGQPLGISGAPTTQPTALTIATANAAQQVIATTPGAP